MPEQAAAPPRTFSGGLVTSRDAVLLHPDELQQAADAEYLPADPAPWKVPGRSAFAAAEASQVNGLAFLEFDQGVPQDTVQPMIVAMVGKKYRKATAGSTGTLSDFSTDLLGTATTLDQVHVANQHFLLNGVDRNHYVQSNGQIALHGMLPAIFGPVVDTAAGALTGFTLSSGKTVTYWIEERVKDQHGNVVRRQASTAVQATPITGSGAVVKPRIYRPDPPVNADATHWAVYATATNGAFPTGAQIGESDISNVFMDDPNTTTDPAIPSGAPYLVLQSTIAGIVSTVARYGPAPISSTGDVFKSCLCINDVKNPRRMWFSFFRDPQAFPAND